MNDKAEKDVSTADEARRARLRGRMCCEVHAWTEAYTALTRADALVPLDAPDLERLAEVAYLTGRDEAYVQLLERAYQGHVSADDRMRAARSAFWLALRMLFRGEVARAAGWLTRAERMLEHIPATCAEHGYLLLIEVIQQLESGQANAAYSVAARAAAIGEQCQDLDLATCARHLQGAARLEQRDIATGLALLDEAMLSVVAGNLSPIMTGLIYCSVIEKCLSVYALTRSREWTTALAAWCESQTGLVSFTGTCLVHRAEIMQFHGDWTQALEEARQAAQRCLAAANRRIAAAAYYQEGEVHRLQGRFEEAEQAYRRASEAGFDPQPGLALLRIAQERTDLALPAIERALQVRAHWLERSRLLPAYIEILLSVPDLERAATACTELEEIAKKLTADALSAFAFQARGTIELASGNGPDALNSLHAAVEVWQRIDAPYWMARARMLTGLACLAVRDQDGAHLEFAAARSTFERLRATPDLARLDAADRSCERRSGLTQRELQVLRAIAEGKTNRVIASELSLSEKTVDRHVSNIFVKLGVPTRAAATAHAYKQKLILGPPR